MRRPPPPRPKPKAEEAEEEEPAEAEGGLPARWRTVASGVLLLAGAAGAGFWALHPERWLGSLDAAPWREIALGLGLLGLLAASGWELGRRLVRVVLVLLACALFPLAGILVAQGLRGPALFVLLAAFLALAGLVGLLAGQAQPWPRAVLSLLVLAGGVAGLVRFGLVEETEGLKEIRRLAAPQRRFEDGVLGVTLELPPGWVLLPADQRLFTAPAGAKVLLGHSRFEGFGYVAVEPAPVGLISADQALASMAERRRAIRTTLQQATPADVSAGALIGREAYGTWSAEGVRYRDLAAVWRDGRSVLSLVAWLPDDGSSRPVQELRALRGGLKLSGEAAKLYTKTLEAAVKDLPQLSLTSLEIVMSRSDALLSPDALFRSAYEVASRGISELDPDESKELGQLIAGAASNLSSRDRTRLMDYFERVRARIVTTPEEDGEMCRLMKGGVLRLSAARQTRLQELYGKAIRAGVPSA